MACCSVLSGRTVWLTQAEYQRLALGYGPRFEDPHRPLSHWDFLLKEAYWLARDVGQVRQQQQQQQWRWQYQ
jgi:hypothetical protein